MERMVRLVIAALGMLALAVASPVAATAAGSDVVGYAYVNDNTAGVNTVAGFARHADGSLTPLPGSPFAIGGAGTGATLGSQGSLQRSGDGRYLLAADAGSSQISVLRIRPDGTLRPAEGSPVSSGGNEPVSLAVNGNLVYVANTGAGGANYTGFMLNAGGHLTPLAGSTFAVPDGSGLGAVTISPDGAHLTGSRVTTSLIDSFAIGNTGLLTAAPGSPFAAQAAGPFGSAFRPTDQTQLYVSNAHAGTNAGSVSAYTVAADGTLTALAGSPYPDLQTAPCWLAISPDGLNLFAANTASDTISAYSIATDGSLTLLGSTALQGSPGVGPFDLQLDPSGHFLYVVDTKLDAVSVLTVTGGTLTELASSPFALPAGATPFGLAIS